MALHLGRLLPPLCFATEFDCALPVVKDGVVVRLGCFKVKKCLYIKGWKAPNEDGVKL